MFGKRDPEAWKAMVQQVDVFDREIDIEESPEVRVAIATVRNEVIIAALPPVQHDLWQSLSNAYRVGDLEIMQIAFKNSGADLTDLLDLLYVADQLSAEDAPGVLEYRRFCEELFELIYRYRGARLDNYLANLFGVEFQSVDRYLLRLAENEQLVRGRLDEYEDLWKKNRKNSNTGKKKLTEYDFQPIVTAGIEKLIDLEAGFSTQEAEDYLLFLHEIDLGFDKINLQLVESASDVRFLFNLMESLVKELKAGGWITYTSGFDTVIAKMVGKMHARGLIYLVNQRIPGLYNERLLALSLLQETSKVSDETVMELMLDHDENQAKSLRETQQQLRREILKKRSLGPRVHSLGLAMNLGGGSLS